MRYRYLLLLVGDGLAELLQTGILIVRELDHAASLGVHIHRLFEVFGGCDLSRVCTDSYRPDAEIRVRTEVDKGL
jgi:hypothetical protein